jgi:hypothetical protein
MAIKNFTQFVNESISSSTKKEVEQDLLKLILLQYYCNQHASKMILINGMGFLQKSQGFSSLFNQLDKTQFLSDDNSPWISQMLDFADDNMHPGEKTNKLYAEQVINHPNFIRQ